MSIQVGKAVCVLLLCACSCAGGTSGFSRGVGYWSGPQDELRSDVWGKLMDVQSQREDWYAVTPYVAEFWCTLSNAAFFYVACKHQSWETALAGIASTASHMIPKQWLHTCDMLGVATILFKLARAHRVIWSRPICLIPGVIAGAVNMADMYLARRYSYTWPHVLWHITAAYAIDHALAAIE